MLLTAQLDASASCALPRDRLQPNGYVGHHAGPARSEPGERQVPTELNLHAPDLRLYRGGVGAVEHIGWSEHDHLCPRGDLNRSPMSWLQARILGCAFDQRSPAAVCIVRRMPRMQVYLPDDLYEQVKTRHLPASELLQQAVRAEVRRQDLLGETDAYLADLLTEVGEPSPQERARAEAIARRIASRRAQQAG